MMNIVKTSDELICRCVLCMGQCVFPFDGEAGIPGESGFGSISPKTLTAMLDCTHFNKNDAVIFVGGFMDGLLCYMLKLAKQYFEMNPNQDVWYVTHDSKGSLTEIIHSYNKQNKQIILVGHSWGGNTATHLLHANNDLKVNMLVTLDPVSKKGAPSKTDNMGEWVNIYVDYDISCNHTSNLLAKIGGPWANVDYADINITHQEWGELAAISNHRELSDLHHSDVYLMFFCDRLAPLWIKILPKSKLNYKYEITSE